MRNIQKIIEMLEILANENEKAAKACKTFEKSLMHEYFKGRADGIRNAAALLKNETINEIPVQI